MLPAKNNIYFSEPPRTPVRGESQPPWDPSVPPPLRRPRPPPHRHVVHKGKNTCGSCGPGCRACRAVRWGKTGAAAMATTLIDGAADVNAVGKDGGGNETTPLWWAAVSVSGSEAGALPLAALLIAKGADVNVVGKDRLGAQSTPLWCAANAVCLGRPGGLQLAWPSFPSS